jgi:CBS domain-containing protein
MRNMHCREIMSHDVERIPPDETVANAAKLMASQNLGLLPICGPDGKPIGVITDRDIALRVVGKDRLAAGTAVEDVMTAPVHSVGPDYPVDRAGELMTKAGVSRLLVVDEDGHLEGLVSVADLLVHAPGLNALVAARAVYARGRSARSPAESHCTANPYLEYFQGVRALPTSGESTAESSARVETKRVVHAGTDDL